MNRNAILAVSIAAASLSLSAWLLGSGIRNKGLRETVEVTGLAEKNFSSDLVVWRGSFNKMNMSLKDAYQMLKEDEAKVKTYLKGKGVHDSAIVFSAVDINQEYDYQYYNGENHRTFQGYRLTQSVKVESKDVNGIERISREVTELIDQGVELNSQAPEYYYTRLAELKLDLIKRATDDAKNRAQKISDAAGAILGKLQKADMGIFQITGLHSSEEFSWGGAFNTDSREKTARITVNLSYNLR